MVDAMSTHRPGPSESDVCRVCRCAATEDQPLFYPCLCSGSIKYVHQDCLVEWLKHSKKKYCELCKHSFSFSPIYRDHMPKSLPFGVLIGGIMRQIGSGFLMALRYALILFAWFFSLPYLTVQPFRYYFGWTWLWELRYLVDAVAGSGLIAVLILSAVGMSMLREYMEQHRLFDFINEVPVKPVDEVLGPEGDLDSPLEEPSDQTGHQPGSWLEQVTPREYRAFLRRREYHREKSERLRVRHHEAQSVKNAEILRMIDAGLSEVESMTNGGWETASEAPFEAAGSVGSLIPSLHGVVTERTDAETFNPYNLDTNGSYTEYRAGSDFTEASTVARRPGPTNVGVVFRESFRCRVCQKRSCVNRDHVIQSSAQQRAQQDPVLEAPPAAAPVRAPAAQQGGHFALFEGLFAEDDGQAGEPVSIKEMLGFEGSLLVALRYLVTIGAALSLVVHATIILPLILGTLIVDGTLPVGLAWLKSVFVFVVLHARTLVLTSLSSKESPVAEYLPVLKANAVKAAVSLLSAWDSSLSALACYLPASTGNRLLMYRPAEVKTYLRLIKPLVLHEPGPSAMVLFRLLAGYSSAGLLGTLCFWSLLRYSPRPFQSPLRELMAVGYLCGAFLKLVSVTSFMFILFPLYSGWLMDYFTLPLFKASLLQRLQFYHDYPAPAMLLHYAPGLAFTFCLSFGILSIRKAVRPGLLHFIRNPEDPDENYAKEVLERPYIGQIFNLAPTFIFYTWIIAVMVGGTVSFVLALFPSVAPLMFSFRDPFSSLPFDVIIQGIGKLVLDVINPYVCTQYLSPFFRAVLAQLRLSSFFLGGRYLPEESFPKGGKWAFVPDFDRVYKREKLRSMARREAQPMDIAKLVIKEGRPMASSIDFSQIPVPRRMPTRKTTAASKNESTKGFTVVFKPNYFFLRVMAMFACLFAYWLLSIVTLFVAPLLTGRYLASFVFDSPIRDTFTFIAGFVVFGSLLRATVDILKGIYASDSQRLYRVFVVAPWTAFKIALISGVFFVLWPLMLGSLLLLAVSPAWSYMNNTRIVSTAELWSAGAIAVKWLLSLKPPYLDQRKHAALQKLKNDGMASVDLVPILREFILPVTLKIGLYLVEPAAIVAVASALLRTQTENLVLYQSYAYLASILRPILFFACSRLRDYRRNLVTRVRDETYLIGNRLHNLEPITPPQLDIPGSPAKTAPLFNGAPASPASTFGSVRTTNSVRPPPSHMSPHRPPANY